MRGIDWKRAAFAIALLIALPLAAGCFPPPSMSGQHINVGGVANGHIMGPGHQVRYPLTISYPRTVSIYVDGHGLDPTVAVHYMGGGRLAFNDDGGQGLDSQLVMPLGPGNYMIIVSGYGGSRGPFTLTVN